MTHTAKAVAALLLAAPALARAQEERPSFTVGGILDARMARTDLTRSWLDGGLGKARYGGLTGEEAELARLAQASLLLDASLSEVLQAHVQLRVDAEPDNALKRGKTGLVEAFAAWRPELSPEVRLRVKTGLFFPPISLEHPLRGWTTAYTITPSAANAWIGEEVRAAGVEGNVILKVKDNDLIGTGAVFGMNDPAGAILAWRGWALHDRTSQTADELPFAAFPFFRPGGEFAVNAPWVSPLREVDGRLGWYAGGAWRWPGVLDARALRWDNRGNPAAFDGRQYAWATAFTSLGLRLELPGPVELLGQHITGSTGMGVAQQDGALRVNADYQASFGLVTVKAGRHRFTARYDRFEVEDKDALQAVDDSDEDGEAWTASYLLETGEHHRLAFEWMRITSDRPARSTISQPVHAEEDLFQASFRVLF